MGIQRYYMRNTDETIDIRIRQTRDGEDQETIISNGLINFESQRSRYNDYSRIDFRFKPSTESGMSVEIFVKNLEDTERRTFAIIVWKDIVEYDMIQY